MCFCGALRVNTSHFLVIVFKTIKRSGFKKYKQDMCSLLPYLGNRIDKLFGYQSYLQATLAERLNSHRLGIISLSLLPIVWCFRLAKRLNTQAMLVFIFASLP
jgi:hypothetical protein